MTHNAQSSERSTASTAMLDGREVDRFRRMADAWWDTQGKFRPLHQIGPARLSFIRQQASAHFGLDAKASKPLHGLTVLDIGCGGGLIAEPVARLGGTVTGVDPGDTNIAIAREHAEGQGLAIDYRVAEVETLAAEGTLFDLVLCLEVVEHVPDPKAFVKVCASLVRPGGLLVLSTLNRTMASFALAIVGAEYVLRWLPRGTHQWERFITPQELQTYSEAAGLSVREITGMTYNPLLDTWSLRDNTDVNYLLAASRPAQ
jgi:2-polyprenyl-6-hydroxyphenyl methylase / 3-demethylubiquinone-9 3-methyltransferase